MSTYLVVVGAVLIWWGRRPPRWKKKQGRQGQETAPSSLSAAIRLELIGAMLDAGLSVSHGVLILAQAERSPALTAVANYLRMGVGWDAAWDAAVNPPIPRRGALPRSSGVKKATARSTSSKLLQAPKGRVMAAHLDDHREAERLRDCLDFAVRTGAPSADLLRAQAARLRRQRHREGEKKAAALGVKLMVPLGTCSLPAFICLGVIPVLMGLVPALW